MDLGLGPDVRVLLRIKAGELARSVDQTRGGSRASSLAVVDEPEFANDLLDLGVGRQGLDREEMLLGEGCFIQGGRPKAGAELTRNREHSIRGSPLCHTRESGYPVGRDAAAQGLRLGGSSKQPKFRQRRGILDARVR